MITLPVMFTFFLSKASNSWIYCILLTCCFFHFNTEPSMSKVYLFWGFLSFSCVEHWCFCNVKITRSLTTSQLQIFRYGSFLRTIFISNCSASVPLELLIMKVQTKLVTPVYTKPIPNKSFLALNLCAFRDVTITQVRFWKINIVSEPTFLFLRSSNLSILLVETEKNSSFLARPLLDGF